MVAIISLKDKKPVLTVVPGVEASLSLMQGVVDGLITTAFTVHRPGSGAHRRITGYVNDEGLIAELPTLCQVEFMGRRSPVFVGNMVITGLDTSTGDTVALDEEDVEWVKAGWNPETRTLSFT